MKIPAVWRAFLVALTVFWFTASPFTRAFSQPPAFAPGEALVFDIKWMKLKAGTVILSVNTDVPLGEQTRARYFLLNVRSTPFLDSVYKVRTRVQSLTDMALTRTLDYQKRQREGRTKRDVHVRFDWDQKTAQYFSSQRGRKPLPLTGDTLDPLSAFYYVRQLPLSVGTQIDYPITDGKKTVKGGARVVARETVKVGSGTYNTYKIIPELKDVGGIFKKSKKARIEIWVTADYRHLPVKVSSKVAVGRFVAELVSATGDIPAKKNAAKP